MTDVDDTGIHFLHDFIDEQREQGIRFAMANPSKEVLRALKRAGLVTKIGAGFMHVNMADAVADADAALQTANLSSQL
jgi:MFS superfamily sulfate permease-like transporter